MKQKNYYYLLVAVSCCFLLGSGVGLLGNVDGIFFTAICEDMNIGRGTIALYGTFSGVCSAFCLPVIPKLMRRYDYHLILRCGIALTVIAIVLMSTAKAPWVFYLLGILRGIGSSTFIFAPVTIVLSNWFNKRRSVVIGIAASFSGVCGAVANTAFSQVIELWGYQTAYLVNALLIAILTIPGSFILRTSPQAFGMDPYGGTIQQKEEEKRAALPERTSALTGCFVAIAVIHCVPFMISTFSQHLQSFAITLGRTAAFGAMLASVALIGNVGAKLLLGAICDRAGPIKSIYIVIGSNIAVMAAYFWCSGEATALVVSSLVFGMIFSIPAVCSSELVMDVYGKERHGDIFSKISLCGMLCNALGVSVFGFVYDLTQSYHLVLLICVGLNVLCAGIAGWLHKKLCVIRAR